MLELLDRADAVRDGARHEQDAAALVAGIDPEAREIGDLEREVDLVALLELGEPRARTEQLAQGLLDVGGGRLGPGAVLERHELAVDAGHRHRSALEVQVGAIGRDQCAERSVKIDHQLPSRSLAANAEVRLWAGWPAPRLHSRRLTLAGTPG